MDEEINSTILINNSSNSNSESDEVVKRANQIVGKLLEHKQNNCPHCDALLREVFKE